MAEDAQIVGPEVTVSEGRSAHVSLASSRIVASGSCAVA